jgi:hypothetical protein
MLGKCVWSCDECVLFEIVWSVVVCLTVTPTCATYCKCILFIWHLIESVASNGKGHVLCVAVQVVMNKLPQFQNKKTQ